MMNFYILFILSYYTINSSNCQNIDYSFAPEYNWNNENTNTPWVRIDIPQPKRRHSKLLEIDNHPPQVAIEQGRHIQPQTFYRISETLDAINTVGRYLVNMTRHETNPQPNEDLPGAIYTISKNVLGRNVTDTIVKPFVQEALPLVQKPIPTTTTTTTTERTIAAKIGTGNAVRSCTTPDGANGICDDLSNCPQLLLNLGSLRQSLCFKSLFTPGVCCPIDSLDDIGVISTTTTPVPILSTTIRIPPKITAPTRPPIIITTKAPILLKPQPTFENITDTLIVDPNDCGQPENANFRVVGGEEATPGKWPWMAAIFLHGPRRTEFWCGGSLITSKHVLTAAHCTKDTRQRSFSPRQFTIRLGDVDLQRDDEPSTPVTVRVTDIRAHPRFSRVGFYNDIALFYLETPVRKSRYIIPLCLPQPSLRTEKFAGQRPTVVGWGTTYYGGKESTVQRQAILPVWRNEDCNQAYFQPITENFICAGYADGGVDACQGDSGGPLMLLKDTRWMQIGIVSFGNKCGEPGYPGVYTRVTEYLDWIEENTGFRRKEEN
ncbi:proclotting enzyme-like [Chrysoperla carnea]|uniref:proclotting enzyme-like n=1 Tax=Chrysoperla carnea TaxID=189513 RepID=UPI001D094CCA|nr:proclotting enzyme-like [Chrysoperla carnea]